MDMMVDTDTKRQSSKSLPAQGSVRKTIFILYTRYT